MKNNYFRTCILLTIFLCLSSLAKSQNVTPLGSHKDFIDKFKDLSPHTIFNKVTVKISDNQSLTLKLNVKRRSGDAEIFIGKVENENNGTFFLSATDAGIDGNIVLTDKKKAFQYYSDASGSPFVKEVDIHKVLCIDYNQYAAPDTNAPQMAPAPGSTAYTLQSLPGATAVALLDFDGQYVSGTRWNSGNPINAAASSFTEAQVTEMWRMISEDYRPFNINITTDSNVFFAAPVNRRQRCIFTPTNTAAPGSGGVAYLNSFSSGSDNDTPCWVFNSGVKSGGEAGSHELGHTFGLSHDGTSTEDYYQGQGYWAPIMGAAYYDILGQWSKGEYTDANNQEDDVAIITKSANGVTYRADEAGNTNATARVLTIAASGTVTGSQNYGIITTRTDIDVYTFTTSGGTVTLTVTPSSLHPDLNVLLKLTDAAGTVLVTADPTPSGTTSALRTASLAATITTTLAAGTYYLQIDGTGEGDPLVTGYSDYACIGEYTVSGTIPVTGGSIPPTVSLTSPVNNAVVCSASGITLTATAADADGTISKVEFFDGTTLISTVTASPYTYNWTSAATGTHSITAKATDNGNLGTTSAAVTITLNTTPSAPSVTGTTVNYCQNATASTLTATGTALKWYTVATGGTGSTTAPKPVTTTIGTTNYYVSQTVSSCESARTMITVNVNSSPSAPTVVTPLTYCQNAVATPLTATGTNLKWYTASTGGTASTTAPTPSTTTLGTTSRYVSQTVNGCESPRAVIDITVNAKPAAPAVNTPVTYCQNAVATVLAATGTNLLWYTTSTGGTGSSTPPVPVTSAIGTTNYYVSVSSNGCESSRSLISVTVNAIPSAPTVTSPVNYCQNASATSLSANGTSLNWYTVASGGTGSSTAPTPLTTTAGNTIYYVSQTTNSCESSRSSILVTVSAPPSSPSVSTPLTYCQNATSSALTATGTGLKWYTAATGGSGSATAPTPVTSVAGTTNYYVSQTVSGCESGRAAIAITVNAAPAPTVTTPVTYCQNAIASALTANGTGLKWYTAASGGTGSVTAPTPVTSTAGTTNYYVSQTSNGCESNRILIAVIVNATPSAPSVNSPVVYCQNSIASSLSATGTGLKWYTAATGGVASTTGPTPGTSTPGTTNYYVSQTTSGCESQRAVIAVTITASPVATITPGGATTFCQGGNVTLTANAGSFYNWFNGNLQVGTGASYSASTSGSYTVEVTNSSGCKASSAPIVITVNTLPASTITAGGPTTFTEGGSVLLSANTGTGFSYRWFNGSSQVGTGSTLMATLTGNYTVEVTNAQGCKANSGITTVTVLGNHPPTVIITAPSDQAILTSPADITISAIASDDDGSITKVEFYNGSTLLGTDLSSAYAYGWNNLPVGTYSITAVATDNLGASTTSSVITISVINQLPVISLTGPVDGSTYVANASVTLEATATDPNGNVALVAFYNGSTLIGTDASAPFSFIWTNVIAGTYNLTAKATDNEGGTSTSDAITITVNANQPSDIHIISPTNNSVLTGNAVTIDVTAADPDGEVVLVEYLDGTTVIGSNTTDPYSFNWNNPSPGTHVITVRVTDSNGGVTVSSSVTVLVQTQTGLFSHSSNNVFDKVYPNPSSSLIQIETGINLENASIKFIDAFGSEVKVQVDVKGKNAEADVSLLEAGLYYLLITQDEYIISKKIIIAR